MDKRSRIGNLDIVRLIASVFVVFWHYRHFGMTSGFQSNAIFRVLAILGAWAPELFFCISGFAMTRGYSEKIMGGGIAYQNS